MKTILEKTLVMQRDSRRTNVVYAIITVLVAIAMLIAASGSGSEIDASSQATLGRLMLDHGGNILAVIIAILVLIPRTRSFGAILAVILMFISMYLNYTIDGIEFFAFAVPYNTITITLSALLIGHYSDDLPHVFKRPVDESKKPIMGGAQ